MKTTTLINLEQHKRIKKAKIIVNDLQNAINLLTSIKKSLGSYYKYIPIKAVHRTVIKNQAVLEAHLAKYQRVLGSNNNESQK